MRLKHFIARVSDLRDSRAAVPLLVFLHELSGPGTRAQPPRDAQWQRIIEQPKGSWGAALDAACRECEQVWPTQLGSFFGSYRFADDAPAALVRAVEAVTGLLAEDSRRVLGAIERQEVLATVYQEMRGLTSKQWSGAFFTPWNLARATAKMAMAVDPMPGELWVADMAAGGAALLHAAYEEYREQHGAEGSRAITLIGVDIDRQVCEIARATLLLAGADPDQYWIAHGNSLAQPVIGEDPEGVLRLIDFHLLLGNPPFGTKTNTATLKQEARTLEPLVVPRRVLYRQIPMVDHQAGGRRSTGGPPRQTGTPPPRKRADKQRVKTAKAGAPAARMVGKRAAPARRKAA
jgi:N-6 DNA Methylase